MSASTILFLIGGLVLLVLGAEWLVRGASSIATRLGIAPIVIGLTVVAFGTSAPEMAVSVGASLSGNADVSLGNVVGSNIFNILFILGISAVFSGLAIEQRLIRIDIPLLTVISFITLGLALNGSFGRIEGAVFFVALLVYTAWLIRNARRESKAVEAEYESEVASLEGSTAQKPLLVQIFFVVAGLALLVLGAGWLVDAATEIAKSLGVSDLVIGLTIVAAGTSLPELATSVTAAIRGQRDIAVGNVVGSNIFNLLAVLGASAAISKDGVAVADAALRLDIPVMIAATIVLIPICWNGFQIKRWEGILLAVFYFAYVAYLILESGESSAFETYRTMMLIVVPVVMLAFGAAGVQGWRRHRRGA
jgi:cation:H+ antiporter